MSPPTTIRLCLHSMPGKWGGAGAGERVGAGGPASAPLGRAVGKGWLRFKDGCWAVTAFSLPSVLFQLVLLPHRTLCHDASISCPALLLFPFSPYLLSTP